MTLDQNTEDLNISYFNDVVLNSNLTDNLHSVIVLLNRENKPVGAIYLDLIDSSCCKLVVSETIDEKYVLMYAGLLIYFSAWKQIKAN